MGEAANSISPITICTLWENDYHKGLASFFNSLVRVGYRGRVWAGYRGDLPHWATRGEFRGDICCLTPADGVELMLCKVDTKGHLAHYKASWMARVLCELEPNSEGVYYFDPDILVLGSWAFFEQWLRSGLAVCEDQSYPVNPTHPLVKMWQDYTLKIGFHHWRPHDVYVNSGLIGVTRERFNFLSVWKKLIEAMQRDFGLGDLLKTGTRVHMFHQTDQDALNMAIAVSSDPVSWVGLDGMGFGRGEWLTLHALSKPWRRRVFRDWLTQGHRPDSALRLYWDLARGPIQVESYGRIQRHRLYIPLAAFLGRLYGRR